METTLITGAGKGIGEQIALKFASENHNLILLINNKSHKLKLLKQLKKYDIKVEFFIGDLKSQKFINKLKKNIKRVDNLINNAAMANKKNFLDISMKEFELVLNVNLKSIFKLSQIFAKKMIKNKIKGNIINLSSQLGHIAAYNRTAYIVSKFGLEGLTKSLAMDLGEYGIRVNTVAPTKTITNHKELIETKKRLKLILKKIPLKKFSTAKEIASIVFFLTTDAANSITGTSIISDGGWTLGK